MQFLTWPNVTRVIAILLLIVLATVDYGFDALAKDIPKEVYFFLIAIAIGIDIKALRELVLRIISGGRDGNSA